MKISPLGILLLAILCLVTPAGGHPLDTSPLATKRDLEAKEKGVGEFGRFGLDADVFAQSATGFADLRVGDDESEEIPLVVRERTDSKRGEWWVSTPTEVVALEVLPEGSIEIVVKRPEKLEGAIEGFSLRTALIDFEKLVLVEGSDDGAKWERLVEPTMIYDYSRFLNNVRSTRVEFAPSSHRQFRIRIEAAVEALDSPVVQMMRESRGGVPYSETEHLTMRRRDFKIEGIDALSVKQGSLRETSVSEDYPVEDLQISHDREKRTTLATFSSGRIPLRAVHVSTGSKYYDREIEIEAAFDSDDPEWIRLAKTRIRSSAGKIVTEGNGESFEFEVGGSRRFSKYRVTISDGDSPPLEDLAFTLKGVAYEGVFYKEGGRRYTLYYGGADMKAPEYDIGRVLEVFRETPMESFDLSEPKANPDYSEDRPSVDRVPGKTILIAVIVIVALFLIFVVARMSGAVERATGSGSS